MKNKNLFWAAVVFTSLLVMACGNGSRGGGTLTLTDIPAKYNGQYIVMEFEAADSDDEIYPLLMGEKKDGITEYGLLISGSTANLPIMIFSKNEYIRYTGSHTFEAEIKINDDKYNDLAVLVFSNITFKDGIAKISWEDSVFLLEE